jgi:hypothetical protein
MNFLYSLRFAVYISYLSAGVQWRARHGTNKGRTKKEIKQKKRKQGHTWMKINNKLNKEQRKNERNDSKDERTINFAVLSLLLRLE